ncbi:hypothetical protein D3C73_708320 [compost metagenome]
MGIEQAAHQTEALPAAQGFHDFVPRQFMIASLGLDHRTQDQQTHRAELAAMAFAGLDQSLDARRRTVQVALSQLPAHAGVLGEDVDFLERRVPGIRVAGVDGLQTRQFGVGRRRFTEDQQPAHLPGQAIRLQPFQAELDCVLVQPFDERQRFLLVARQPLHVPQHLQHAQDRVGDRNPLQDIDPSREQFERRVDVVGFVQHFAQQRSGEVSRVGTSLAALAGLMQHIAINPFRLGHLAFQRQAQANHATPLKAARRGAQQRLAIDQQGWAVELHLAGLFIFAAMHVQPRQDVRARTDGHAIAARWRVEQLRQDRHGCVGVIPLQRQGSAQQRDHETVVHLALGNIAEQLFEAVGAGVEIPGVELHPGLEDPQLDPRLYLLDRQQPNQLDQHAQVAMGIQRLGVLLHQIGSGRGIAAHHRMVHRFVQVAMVTEPVPGTDVHGVLFGLAA